MVEVGVSTVDAMDERGDRPEQVEVEAAVRATLIGWGAELDTFQKFRWMDDDRRRARGDAHGEVRFLRGR